MAATLADVVEALRQPEATDPKQAALDHLSRLVALRAELERHITEAVAAAKQEGANWTEMGAQLGMLRGNAQRKYDPLLDERVERTVTVKREAAPRAGRKAITTAPGFEGDVEAAAGLTPRRRPKR